MFAKRLPIIYGDGVHDDTAGLQALIDGAPHINKSGVRKFTTGYKVGDIVDVINFPRGGEFVLKRPIEFRVTRVAQPEL